MKIKSRPDELGGITLGTGGCELNMTDDQLTLLCALICNCRLGQNTPYSVAAYELLQLLENEYGNDFIEDCSDQVGLEVTIEDDAGSVVLSTKSGNYYPTLEI